MIRPFRAKKPSEPSKSIGSAVAMGQICTNWPASEVATRQAVAGDLRLNQIDGPTNLLL